MPAYEASLILRTLSKPEMVTALKRMAEKILDQGGVLRQFASMGTSPLPYRMRSHNRIHKEGSYFIMKFDAPASAMATVRDELGRDIDLVRYMVFNKEAQNSSFECTLEDELQPPAYRKDVQKLINDSKSVTRGGYNRRTPGFDYYPFQR